MKISLMMIWTRPTQSKTWNALCRTPFHHHWSSSLQVQSPGNIRPSSKSPITQALKPTKTVLNRQKTQEPIWWSFWHANRRKSFWSKTIMFWIRITDWMQTVIWAKQMLIAMITMKTTVTVATSLHRSLTTTSLCFSMSNCQERDLRTRTRS